MISLEDFYRVYTAAFERSPNPEQKAALEAPPLEPLFIVAGPGTGKTTCLTLRILKLVLVDGIPPNGILATTFTVKAATELRSRILGWGFRLIEALQSDAQIKQQQKDWLAKVDVNQVTTGTIDSICDEILRRFRSPAEQPPVLVDDYVSKTLLLREGLFSTGLYQDPDLRAYLLPIHGSNAFGFNVGRMNDLLQSIWDRRIQDQVDWPSFIANGQGISKGRKSIDKALAAYGKALNDRSMVDFALLGQRVLERFRAGALSEFSDQVRVVLVDEYQDTNLLQESIYFEIAKCCNGAISVVGDDDQNRHRKVKSSLRRPSVSMPSFGILTIPPGFRVSGQLLSMKLIFSGIHGEGQLSSSWWPRCSRWPSRRESRCSRRQLENRSSCANGCILAKS